MMLSIRDYSVDVATCDEEPANFAGTWTGEYACDNVGCGDESGPIELTITQTGHSARYVDDSGAAYSGTVCGDEFAFDGGVEGPGGYVEKGRFTMNSDGTLRKESSFVTNDGSCRGDCEDSLERQDI